MVNPLVSVIIVNWNGKELLEDCLKSVYKTTYKNKEVIVVDNASKDDSVEYVKKNYPSARIVINKENLGFAEGNDVGFLQAKGDAILFLSNDTLVEKNVIDILIKTLYSSSTIGAVMPKILQYPQKEKIDSVGSFFLNSGFLYHYGHDQKDQKQFNKKQEIFSMKGACMLFKKEVIKKVGKLGIFDKDYFAYFEETDLCHRVWLSGYKVLCEPSTAIYHKGGRTSKRINYAWIQYNSFKNRIATYIKNFEVQNILTVLPLHLIFCEVTSFGYLAKFKFNESWGIQKAIFWNIIHLNETLAKRKVIQTTMRKIPDSEFLPKLTWHVRLSYYYYLFTGHLDRYKE